MIRYLKTNCHFFKYLHYSTNNSNAKNFEIRLTLFVVEHNLHSPSQTTCKNSFIVFNFYLGRRKACGIILFFCATNSQGMVSTPAGHCVTIRKICCVKEERESGAGRKFHIRILQKKKEFCLKYSVPSIDKSITDRCAT